MMNVAVFIAPTILESYAINEKGEITTLNGASVHQDAHIIDSICYKAGSIVTTWTSTTKVYEDTIATLLKILGITKDDLHVVNMGKRTPCHEILSVDVNHPMIIKADMAFTLLSELYTMRNLVAAARADLFVDNAERDIEQVKDMLEYQHQDRALHLIERMTTALMNIHERVDGSFVVIGL